MSKFEMFLVVVFAIQQLELIMHEYKLRKQQRELNVLWNNLNVIKPINKYNAKSHS